MHIIDISSGDNTSRTNEQSRDTISITPIDKIGGEWYVSITCGRVTFKACISADRNGMPVIKIPRGSEMHAMLSPNSWQSIAEPHAGMVSIDQDALPAIMHDAAVWYYDQRASEIQRDITAVSNQRRAALDVLAGNRKAQP
jgi:hypothetical protein